MTLRLAFSAMTQKCYVVVPGQRLKQTQRKFLSVVFDRPVSLIDGPAFEKFLAITTGELAPPDSGSLQVSQ